GSRPYRPFRHRSRTELRALAQRLALPADRSSRRLGIRDQDDVALRRFHPRRAWLAVRRQAEARERRRDLGGNTGGGRGRSADDAKARVAIHSSPTSTHCWGSARAKTFCPASYRWVGGATTRRLSRCAGSSTM